MSELAKVNYYVEELQSLVTLDKEAAQGAYFSELRNLYETGGMEPFFQLYQWM